MKITEKQLTKIIHYLTLITSAPGISLSESSSEECLLLLIDIHSQQSDVLMEIK